MFYSRSIFNTYTHIILKLGATSETDYSMNSWIFFLKCNVFECLNLSIPTLNTTSEFTFSCSTTPLRGSYHACIPSLHRRTLSPVCIPPPELYLCSRPGRMKAKPRSAGTWELKHNRQEAIESCPQCAANLTWPADQFTHHDPTHKICRVLVLWWIRKTRELCWNTGDKLHNLSK